MVLNEPIWSEFPLAIIVCVAIQYAGSRDVFDGIEFYLPQLAHMIIHLEVEWDDAILERFALVIAQQSVHFALQLNWILQGALQDYQPECYDEEGASPNPNYNPVFYLRCLKLLKNVERCVVYGKPRAQELHRLYEKGKITKNELAILEQADRRFNALQITAADDSMEPTERLDGWLYFTPPHKAGNTQPAQPKPAYRFLVLERQVLNVYSSKGGCSSKLKLDRAMSVEKSTIEPIDTHSIRVVTSKYSFEIKCGTQEEKNLWVRRLKEEAAVASLFQSHMAFAPLLSVVKSIDEAESEEMAATDRLKSDLTEAQRNRYEFFQAERVFVDNLTNIAEELRFNERAERKKLAPGKMEKLPIPPNVYLPLCNSSDIWRRVADKLADETRVFNTKERCPVVMHFVSKRGETSDAGVMHPNMDVAEYMHNHFDVVAETEVIELNESDDEAQASPAGESSNHMRQTRTPSNVWEEDHVDDDEGTGGPEDSANAATTSVTSPKGTVRMRGNQKVQRLLRESVVTLPNMLAKRLKPSNSKKRIVSVMDRQTEMQPMVVILEGNMPTRVGASSGAPSMDNADDGSVVSVEKSSVLYRDQILLGQLDEGDIDMESIKRATSIISGGESWAQKSAKMLERARKKSEELGEKCQLEISSCLAKSNDDLRQEVFVMQMIHYYKSVFAQAKLPIWLKTYRILSTSSSTGLLELLTDATSLDALKKSPGYPTEGGLRKYFETTYGGANSQAFKAAQTNFVQSLAGYALVSYLLGLKDRHNGNIMIDTRGHLIFIDFGFAMGMRPGHEFSFERAPFKLTKEYVEVMDGVGSECYKEFERLFVSGFEECRRNSQIALGLVEIMMYKSNYPCFSGWRYGKGRALTMFEERLMLRVPEPRVKAKALRLIRKSRQHFGTYLYDKFQLATNGYAM
jgi:phosphatidylinositol 4-kinase A